jgi:hypothetical protein
VEEIYARIREQTARTQPKLNPAYRQFQFPQGIDETGVPNPRGNVMGNRHVGHKYHSAMTVLSAFDAPQPLNEEYLAKKQRYAWGGAGE